jgi:hypothetical protein
LYTARMKKITHIAAAALILIPFFASAHEQRVLNLNGTLYEFVVGSLGEPIIVDDKTGLDLTITKIGSEKLYGAQVRAGKIPESAAPVSGLEATIKAEVFVGTTVMPMSLSGVWGQPGKYKTLFFPTEVTKLGYHIHGTIDSATIDERFTCSEKGHTMNAMQKDMPGMAHEKTPELPANTVFQTGSFGCPKAKAEFGFPQKAHEQGETNYAQLLASITSVLALGASAFAYIHSLRKHK